MDFLLNCAPIIEAWKNSFLFSLNWLPIFLFYLAIPVQRFRNYQTTRLRSWWIVRLHWWFGCIETASFAMQRGLRRSQHNCGEVSYSTPYQEMQGTVGFVFSHCHISWWKISVRRSCVTHLKLVFFFPSLCGELFTFEFHWQSVVAFLSSKQKEIQNKTKNKSGGEI